MRLLLHNLQLNRWFFGFMFCFAYAQSIQLRILVRDQINYYTFTPEGAIYKFFLACLVFLIIGKVLQYLNKGAQKLTVTEVIKIFGISLLVFLLVLNFSGFIISLAFNTVERNFNQETLLRNNLNSVLDFFIYGSFFLAYSFYKKNKAYNKQLATYNTAISNIKIAQLKTQLNPHFLFNNLNVLDQLIEEDKEVASNFLNDFAELYRYVLKTSDIKLVSLEEELAFAKNYFQLLQRKHGAAYTLEIIKKGKPGFIPPLSLQLLLENAIEHNEGNESHPVNIRIEINEKLHVSNNMIKKKYLKKSGGRALKNLKEQYEFLSHELVEVREDHGSFSVSLPVIPKPVL